MMTPEEEARYKREWEEFTAQCHAKGLCEFSGLLATRCVQSICDCFETMDGAIEIERKAGLRQ